MRLFLGVGLLLAWSSVPLFAGGTKSETFKLSAPARIGEVQLERGPCKVTWSEVAGSQVQLTIVAGDRSVTVPARLVRAEHPYVAPVTEVVNGVRYLRGFYTEKAEIILQEASTGQK
jgi:hypothetical protein